MEQDTPSAQLAHALSECSKLADRLLYLEREVVLTRISLEQAWHAVPPMKVRPWRPCKRCKRPTQETVGHVAMCSDHLGDTRTIQQGTKRTLDLLLGDD